MRFAVTFALLLTLTACGGSGGSSTPAPATGGLIYNEVFGTWDVNTLGDVDVTGRGILLTVEQANWQATYAGIVTLWMRDGTGCSEVYYINSDIDITQGGATGTISGQWVSGGPCTLPTSRSAAETTTVLGTMSVAVSGVTLTLETPFVRTVVATKSVGDYLIMRVVSDTAPATASLYESYFISGTPVSYFEWPTLPWSTIFSIGSGDSVSKDSYYVGVSSAGDHPANSYTAAGTLNGLCIGFETGATPSFSYTAP